MKELERCHSIDDVRALARRRLPHPVFDYLDGGAETEYTLRRNTAAFDERQIVPRCLVDVAAVSTATRILGQDIRWPVFCSPTGGSRSYHPEGELAVARAAAQSGTFYSLSTMATHSLEAVMAASQGPKIFQLFIFKDRDITRELIERCKRAGYKALCLTVDAAVRGKRERELRSGMGVPMKLTWAAMASFAMRPGWLLRQACKGPITLPVIAERTGTDSLAVNTRFISEQLDPSVSWKDVRWMIEQWGGPFAIKGIMAPDSARRAADVGASAVIVSNHGGRQLDGVAAPIDVLPQIAQAVSDRLEVILDGGVRRGVHVLKALALGAKACSVGRPYLYGLAAAGEEGVLKALNILHTEFIRAMQLSGCTDARSIDPAIVRADIGKARW
jgi:L-lactate dehydrogenase (cytochrome)